MRINDAGQVELKLEAPWREGTTHLVMSPLEFMQRLATMVPRPPLPSRMTGSRLSVLAVSCPGWLDTVRPRNGEAVGCPAVTISVTFVPLPRAHGRGHIPSLTNGRSG